MRDGWEELKAWTARWGFSLLVIAAAAISLIAAVTVALPDELPGVALGAIPVYRLEVGGTIFVGLYLMAISIVLALQNRGFTEFGTAGVRSERLDEMSEAVLAQEDSMDLLSQIVAKLSEPRHTRVDDRDG